MKRKLFMMIAGVMALLLPACGAKEDERNGAVVVEGITSDESDFDGNGYQKIYGRIVSEGSIMSGTMTVMQPAACPARTPFSLSSNTKQSSALHPIRSAAHRKISGAGFPHSTSVPLTTASK